MKKDWEIKKLGDICELITKGTTPTSIGFDFQNKGINFVKIESFSEDGTIIENKVAHISKECHEALKRSQLQKGDILFSIAGALGRTAIIDESVIPANTNQALAIIRLQNKDITFIKFLLYYFKTDFILKQIEKDKGGVAQQNLSLKQIGDFEIPVPPLEEQKRIVKILDQKFAEIEKLKTNAQTQLKNAKDLFQSQLTKAFSKTSWEKKRLGDICRITSGGTPSRTNKSYWENGDIPWVKTTELQNNELNSTEEFITQKGLNESSAKIVPKDTILLAMYGQGKTRGMTAYLNFEATTNQACACILPSEDKNIYTKYIWKFLIGNYENIRNLAIGCNQPNLNSAMVKSIEIPLPPLPEQKRIVKELDTLSEKVRQLQEIYTNQIANCDELKQSFLAKAFAGEL